tara:strand:+ start:177 stop:1013 length:837 start_codon:yes stop_codon:yes gene_type:complete
METSREDVSIAIRSAFLNTGTKQRFSLIVLVALSIFLLFIEQIETKPLNYFRSIIKDGIYRGSLIVSSPFKGLGFLADQTKNHINLYSELKELREKNVELKNKINKEKFLIVENKKLKELIQEQYFDQSTVISRVMLDKKSPYLNSFVINSGTNKKIKNGMAVLNEGNFIGRIVDVNFFSSRVLLISDLNSKIPVIIEPNGYHAILSGNGKKKPRLEFLPENYEIEDGSVVYTSGMEGIFDPGLPIGETSNIEKKITVTPFSDLSQITFVNIVLKNIE